MALYGWALWWGVGIAEDRRRGKQLLKQSQNLMARAWRFQLGIGIQKLHSTCFQLLKSTGCDKSDPHVQYMLGNCYSNGWGCTMNKSRAVRCYELAGNHLGALKNLGSISDYARDYARAAVLYRHAAEQGYDVAKSNLAVLYGEGRVKRPDL
eukprot:TRINITY_DN4431_c1_g2_i1.p1 TRINITY_DN4431_c1_g2~~TRINITY_DN4431_c1_g2_i1.p1  ORF type:complete len:165 (+),score=16.43 TRINITY_DN4431_c1_g2_i1:41-496(+)